MLGDAHGAFGLVEEAAEIYPCGGLLQDEVSGALQDLIPHH